MDNRLPDNQDLLFHAQAIDRTQPFTFLLDGYEIPAYAGDTVLSAALAAGISGAGSHLNSPIALTEQFAPRIMLANDDGANPILFDMARTPAHDGAAFSCAGAIPASKMRRAIEKLTRHQPVSANVDFDTSIRTRRSTPVSPPSKITTDFLIIGGGVAGMTAARAAGEQGYKVLLVDRRPCLGGDIALFGDREGEKSTRDTIQTLSKQLHACDGIKLMLGCEALEAQGGGVIIQRVLFEDGQYIRSTQHITAAHIVIATGCADRMPIFNGNRLPGVVGLASSFHLAQAYGVWPGQKSLIVGGSNSIYRLGMAANDAGKNICQIADTRVEPHSRFRDFAKAYGIQLAVSTEIRGADFSPKTGELTVETGLSWDTGARTNTASLLCDRLIVSEGWLPRLMLWQQLGGHVIWSKQSQSITAGKGPKGLHIIGSAANYIGTKACMDSAKKAIALCLGQNVRAVKEDLLPEVFESRDAIPSTRISSTESRPAYLSGRGLSILPGSYSAKSKWLSLSTTDLEIEPATPGHSALCLEEIENLVRQGFLDTVALSDVLTERMVSPTLITAKKSPTNTDSAHQHHPIIPRYLEGRFGKKPLLCTIEMPDARRLEAGSLIYETSDGVQPHLAIGCIIAADAQGNHALIKAEYAHKNAHISVSEIQRMTIGRIISLKKVA